MEPWAVVMRESSTHAVPIPGMAERGTLRRHIIVVSVLVVVLKSSSLWWFAGSDLLFIASGKGTVYNQRNEENCSEKIVITSFVSSGTEQGAVESGEGG